MDKRELNRIFKFQVKELRQVFKSFDLIQGAPSDELDGLIHKLLSSLQMGADEKKIERIVDSELIVTYGFTSNEIEPASYAVSIVDWWNNR